MNTEPITEDWLRSSGFKWEEIPRSGKHWLLWLGGTTGDAPDHLGIEVSHNTILGDFWFVWIRADYAGRYSRLIHVRHMNNVGELARLIEGLTGIPFIPADAMYGALRTPEQARRMLEESVQLHQRLATEFGRRYAIDAKVENDESKRGLLNDNTKP